MLQIYTEYLFVGKVGIFVYRVEFHCVVQFYFYIIAGPLQRQYRREIDSDKKRIIVQCARGLDEQSQ
jgi:hypothetical protein